MTVFDVSFLSVVMPGEGLASTSLPAEKLVDAKAKPWHDDPVGCEAGA